MRCLRFSSSTFFASPAFIISQAAADARAISSSTCGSSCNVFLRGSSARVGMRLEIQLPTPLVGYVGVELGGREIGMSEHFLNGSQVCSSLEQVSRKRVAEEVGVDALGVEAGLFGQLAEDQEGARPRQSAAAGVQEQLGPVAECRGTGGRGRGNGRSASAACAADRHDPFLAALADHSNEAVVEVDAGLVEPDRLGDAQARAVEQLDERLVAQRARLRAGGGLDQAFRLARRKRLRQRLGAPRQLDRRGGVVVARAEQLLVAVEAARGGGAARDRRAGEPVGAQLRRVALELLERRLRDRLPEVRAELPEVAAVGLDRLRRPPRGEQREEALDVAGRAFLQERGWAPS